MYRKHATTMVVFLFFAALAHSQGAAADGDVSKLTEQLRGKDQVGRYEAAETLGRLGEQAASAIPDLKRALSDKDDLLRIMAARALVRITPDNKKLVRRATEVAVAALKKGNAYVRPEAEAALTEIGKPSVASLVELLKDANPAVKQSAARIVGRIGLAAQDATEELIRLLDDKQPGVRAESARALGQLGQSARAAIPKLIACLKDDAAIVRANAAEALGHFGPAAKEAAEALADALGDHEHDCCCSAAGALVQLGPHAADAAPALIKTLREDDPKTRAHAVCALANIGDQAVPLLEEALKDKQSRYWAMMALAEIGSAAGSAVPALVEMLDDKDEQTRREVLLCLAEIGPDAKSSLSAVIERLDDADPSVQQAAAYALGNLGPAAKSALGDLQKLIDGDDALLSVVSARAVARIDRSKVDAIAKHLVARVGHDEIPVRVAAIRALADIEHTSQESIAALIAALRKGQPSDVIMSASDALVQIGQPAVKPLIAATDRSDTRLGALVILGRLGPTAKAAVSTAAKALQDKDPNVRHAAIVCLGEIGPDAKPALPALRAALRDTVPNIRQAASVAIDNIERTEP